VIGRKHRFHGHNSVSRVRGERVQLPLFLVFYARNHKRQDYRMAVVVSKKTAKSAVTRNRIRRRLYESVRVQKILDGQAVDVVFVVRSTELFSATPEQISLQVAKACNKIVDR